MKYKNKNTWNSYHSKKWHAKLSKSHGIDKKLL